VLALCAGFGLPAGVSTVDGAVEEADWTTAVDRRVESWRPKPGERRFDQIGWVRDIRTALALAKQHERPVFLFTLDGRMEMGRQ
jgi:hypothetical protein